MHERSSSVPSTVAVVAAFTAVYTIWGSTYLAIRVAVETLPPFLMAGVRFVIAGSILYTWMRVHGTPAPTRVNWRSALIVGGLLLVGGNGGVCWAEQSVPSGTAALLVSSVPLWMVLLHAIHRGGARPGRLEIVAILLGFVGVGILVEPGRGAVEGRGPLTGHLVLILASLLWAIGSLYSRRAPLPKSAWLSTGMEMLAGGVLLLVVSLGLGEWSRLEVGRVSLGSVLALGYLIVFGALVGFTAYIWLLQVTTPARVSTYAYVNPAVAVLLGWAILGESVSVRTFIAMGIIVTAVVLITTYRAGRSIAGTGAVSIRGKDGVATKMSTGRLPGSRGARGFDEPVTQARACVSPVGKDSEHASADG